MRVATISPQSTTHVLLDEIKQHLRIDGADEDAGLGALSAAAVALVESYLDLALIDRTVEIYLDQWAPSERTYRPEAWWSGVAEGSAECLSLSKHEIDLPVKPISAIHEVTVKAVAGGDEVIWPAGNYNLKQGLNPVLVRQYGQPWPVVAAAAEGIKIRATAGFGSSWNDVPASIRQAILLLVAHLYYNRGDEGSTNAMKASGAASLLACYKEARL